ncbi:hypothetical protein [Methylomagnum ishizawai]|uniref:hypothetical protein n=1 Tax=Methylomagnum ishizawai TaxID=1760988 RepID=UPI001C335396|nr:hypothetical protein [Methylomagnum ishizawai]BBL77236.1 hypothetical protein MishRS11D_43340 [Methylomagnum ishizawai]
MNKLLPIAFNGKWITLALAAGSAFGCTPTINLNVSTDKPIVLNLIVDKPIEVKLGADVAVTKLPPIDVAVTKLPPIKADARISIKKLPIIQTRNRVGIIHGPPPNAEQQSGESQKEP